MNSLFYLLPEPTPTRKRTLDSTEPSLTVAKTPKLETRNRFRPPTVISQAELEEKEIEEIKKCVSFN